MFRDSHDLSRGEKIIMDTKIHTHNTFLKQTLREEIQRLVQNKTTEIRQLPIYRIEIPIPETDPLVWLTQQNSLTKLFWSGREGEFSMAGIGEAHTICGENDSNYPVIFSKMSRKLSSGFKYLRYYGGVCFDPKNFSKSWGPFGQYHFTIPRFEIFKTSNQTFFVCNIRREEWTSTSLSKILQPLNNLNLKKTKIHPQPVVMKKERNNPTEAEWQKLAQKFVKQLQKGTLRKIVLARQSILEAQQSLKPLTILGYLRNTSANCYCFCLQRDNTTTFLGASPERLYKRQGLKIFTEALAGTRPRGKTYAEDQKFKNDLLNSEKDWHEHQLVVEWIKNILSPMCSQLKIDNTFSLLKLSGGHHLVTRMQGQLHETVDDAMILERLHPTPAVAGWPKNKALQFIRDTEPFSRGYYAAPVGYVGYDLAEFAVAIRSGLIQKNKITLYSGAGLVDASQPKEEWQETESKLKLFFDALRL